MSAIFSDSFSVILLSRERARKDPDRRLRAYSLNFLHDIEAINHTAEHNVLAVEPVSLDGTKEELGSIGVGAGVGRGQNAGALVLELEVLILKLGAVDRLAASAVVVREVTALAHEVRNDTVEAGALETEALLAGAERAEVFARLGHSLRLELHGDAARGGAADGHVKVHFRRHVLLQLCPH